MKRVESIDPETLQREVLATFWLVDGRVVADYRDPRFGEEIEALGIYTVETGKVKPRDGTAFYAALDDAYSRSSFMHVVQVD
jgi:hypothetical protein